jgi:hypothetical protein
MACLLACLVLCGTPAGQATIPIGNSSQPWGGTAVGPLAMTPDGEWIVAVESGTHTCTFESQRVVIVRPDGTDHRILVDYPELWALKPTTVDEITLLRVSGDGSRAYFVMPTIHPTALTCDYGPPAGHYLLDTESGVLMDFAPDGLIAGDVSWSDDGRRMAFRGFNPQTQSPWFFLGGPDGSGAVPFLDSSHWPLSKGLLSGDGSHFLVMVRPMTSILGDVYVHDMRRGTLTKVTPAPAPSIQTANLSADGTRVAYSHSGNTYVVNGDGTDHRLLSTFASRGTITRDGEYVFVGFVDRYRRISWDGSDVVDIPESSIHWGGGLQNLSFAPVRADGKVLAFWTDIMPLGPYAPMAVWFEKTPVLATYGLGLPGSVLTWEVGGAPGSTFLLAWSPVPTSIRLPLLGTLGLSPNHLRLLGSGTVTSVTNTGKLQVTLPPDLGVLTGATLHFQALSVDAVTGDKALTNTTTFTFPAAFSIQPAALSSEERLWIEQALGQGHSTPRMPDDPWLLHALHDPTLDVSLMNAQVRR